MSPLRATRNFAEQLFPSLRLWRLGIKCAECEGTGMASYEDRIGAVTYHVLDNCRLCEMGARRRGPPSGDA